MGEEKATTDGHRWARMESPLRRQVAPNGPLSAFIRGLTACSKTSGSPREGARPTRFPPKSACIIGPVPSPGGFFNRLLAEATQISSTRSFSNKLGVRATLPPISQFVHQFNIPLAEQS